EQRADQAGLSYRLRIIVMRVIDPQVGGKTLIAGVSGLKTSQANPQDGMGTPHAERIEGHVLPGSGPIRPSTIDVGYRPQLFRDPARVDIGKQHYTRKEGDGGGHRQAPSLRCPSTRP